VKTEPKLHKRLPHIEIPEHTYFITFRTHQYRILNSEEKDIICDVIDFNKGIKYDLISYVILPDHVHVILTPLRGKEDFHRIQDIIKSIKGFSAYRINEVSREKGSIWQAGYFDKVIRDENDLLKKLQYIVNNPLKADVVENIESYKWIYVRDYLER